MTVEEELDSGLRDLLTHGDAELAAQGVALVLALADPKIIRPAAKLLSQTGHEWALCELLGQAASWSDEHRAMAEKIVNVQWRSEDLDVGTLARLPNLQHLRARAHFPPARLVELKSLKHLELRMMSVSEPLLEAAGNHPSLSELSLIDVATDSLEPLRDVQLRRFQLLCYDKQIDPTPLRDLVVDELEVSTTFEVSRLARSTAEVVTLRRMRWDGECLLPRARTVLLNDVGGDLAQLADSLPMLEQLTIERCPDRVNVRGLDELEHLRELEIIGTRVVSFDFRSEVMVRQFDTREAADRARRRRAKNASAWSE